MINVHAPDHGKLDLEWDKFIGQLELAIASRAIEDDVYIGGDFNAYTRHPGRRRARPTRCGRGRQLVTLIGLYGLALATSLHPPTTGSHTTFHSHNSSSQIDYWAVDRHNTADVTVTSPQLAHETTRPSPPTTCQYR